ncbi:hypothetical protein PR048_013503 [Dryococelus australis]|uniref:Uncharacterized protein n=1 Tax=Dryococelus australis TaxID=614101 RepID=A0ABQ9HTV1_9NEOP|nr:hypothetical protein PR048_013503 [Dryococelus australis]
MLSVCQLVKDVQQLSDKTCHFSELCAACTVDNWQVLGSRLEAHPLATGSIDFFICLKIIQRMLENELFPQWAYPRVLLSDNGTQSSMKQQHDLYSKRVVIHHTTTFHHLCANRTLCKSKTSKHSYMSTKRMIIPAGTTTCLMHYSCSAGMSMKDVRASKTVHPAINPHHHASSSPPETSPTNVSAGDNTCSQLLNVISMLDSQQMHNDDICLASDKEQEPNTAISSIPTPPELQDLTPESPYIPPACTNAEDVSTNSKYGGSPSDPSETSTMQMSSLAFSPMVTAAAHCRLDIDDDDMKWLLFNKLPLLSDMTCLAAVVIIQPAVRATCLLPSMGTATHIVPSGPTHNGHCTQHGGAPSHPTSVLAIPT